MNCACSAAPWKKFIQGLAQVHNVPAVVAKSPRFSALPLSTVPRAAAAPRLTTRSTTRSFGTMGIQRQEASSVAAVDGDVSVETTTTTTMTTIASKSTEAGEIDAADQTMVKNNDAIASVSATEATASSDKQPRVRKTRTRDEGLVSGYGAGETEKRSASSASMSPAATKTIRAPRPGSVNNISSSSSNIYKDDDTPDQPGKPRPPRKEQWQIQKEALKAKFPDGWAPRKRLSPDALAGIRALNAQFPDVYTTKALADKFAISPEAIRRVLRSKWTPSAEEEQDRQERWFRRGKQVWERQAALGVKPPKKWRKEGIARDVEWHERRERAIKWEREWEEREKNEERERRARERGWYGIDGADGMRGGGEGGGEGERGGRWK
ncbi:hypothetical protein E4U21_005963 [Claviceps maximensis]|nr:hypothetical protein E4U21_005963 [Claviceps maximensis]